MKNRNYESDDYGSDEGNRGRSFGGNRGGGSFGGPRMTPPVSEGEEIEVTIEAIAAKGDGLAKKNGFVIFVPGTKEGQKVKVRVTRVLRRLAFAEVVGAASAAPKTEEAPAKESENFGEESAEKTEETDGSEEDEEASGDSEDF
jgi:predicted RNA-binding protein with TRAM domain